MTCCKAGFSLQHGVVLGTLQSDVVGLAFALRLYAEVGDGGDSWYEAFLPCCLAATSA